MCEGGRWSMGCEERLSDTLERYLRVKEQSRFFLVFQKGLPQEILCFL